MRPIAVFFFFSSLCLALCTTATAATPNIVLMMADDMGIGDTSAYQDFTGNANDVQVHTPNMERLARMGVRFTDAHTPTSRCSGTRYGLLTGRYPWRNRLKHWVLFGAQGDPMIEPGRPTIATMLRDNGYRTAIVGKWHVGLRYRQSDGKPAADWNDADLTQPLHTCPLDHGFDFSRITSRSHGTSGPDAADLDNPRNKSPNGRGPGHVHGRKAIGARSSGRELTKQGPTAYILKDLGGRHSDSVMEFMTDHVSGADTKEKPFFVYYPSNSNHGPYTPDTDIAGVPVAGAARTKSGAAMDARHDFIYENDVALGRVLNWLENTDDPRNPGEKLIRNSLVIFTSDNGAEKKSNIATGPFRSNKGSAYEGGHRVPFIVSWAAGQVGVGRTNNESLIALQDLYATFAEIVGAGLPMLAHGSKGAEDSRNVLPAFRGETLRTPHPLFHNDHNQAKDDHAACAIRMDIDAGASGLPAGKWKLFFDAGLVRFGIAKSVELYDLSSDQWEKKNLIKLPQYQELIEHLTEQALLHRQVGGHRIAKMQTGPRIEFDLRNATNVRDRQTVSISSDQLRMSITASEGKFNGNDAGLGIDGGNSPRVDLGETVEITFDKPVILESASVVAGKGTCGGSYEIGNHAPLAIYCVDADNDAKDQRGVLSDLGVLPAGEKLRLSSSPHLGVEAKGSWRLSAVSVRVLE